MDDATQAQHILELSRELLDDVELDRVPVEKLLLKVTRLARLAGSDEVRAWLGYEISGYNFKDEIAQKYLMLTGRWADPEEKKAYIVPLAQLESIIESSKARMDSTKLSSLSGQMAVGVIHSLNKTHIGLSNSIRIYSGIRSRVVGLLHAFIAKVYYERQFADLAESTFDGYKRDVDGLIADKAGDVLQKMPSVISRLKEADPEAISQALTTCRRILESFADAIFPPSDGTYDMGGGIELKLDAGKHQNRINAYVAQRCASKSRRTRLKQNLSSLFDRVSAGVHNDVSAQEAYSLFLNVYLFLGEILNLGDPVSELSVD